ncbi:putative reverse transcriptase domain-containing protein [Tanacetum coccineum]
MPAVARQQTNTCRDLEKMRIWYQSKCYRAPVVMSSASYAVTYTSVHTPPRARKGIRWTPIQPVAHITDYIQAPRSHNTTVPQDEDEREAMFIQPHDPDYVLEPIYPEYIPLEDEHVFSVEEQPLPPIYSTILLIPGEVKIAEMMRMRQGGQEEEEEALSSADSAVVVPPYHSSAFRLPYPSTRAEDLYALLEDAQMCDGDSYITAESLLWIERRERPLASREAGITRKGLSQAVHTSEPLDPPVIIVTRDPLSDTCRLRYRFFEILDLGRRRQRSVQLLIVDERHEMRDEVGIVRKDPLVVLMHTQDLVEDTQEENVEQVISRRCHVYPYLRTLDETICELTNDFKDQKLRTSAGKAADNKRKGCSESVPIANVANTQKGNRANPKGNGCFKCGAPRHFKKDCPKLKNKDGGNGSAQGWVYAVGNAEKKGNASRDPDSNVATENSYDVELADGKIVGIFLAQISAKKEEDKSKGKQLKDVPIVQDFSEVFPEDLLGLPPARLVEFQEPRP